MEKTEEHFEYDPTLWASVEKDIAIIPFQKNMLIISAIIGFVATGAIALYLHSGSDSTNEPVSVLSYKTQILAKDETRLNKEAGTIATGINSERNNNEVKDHSKMNLNKHGIKYRTGQSNVDKTESTDRHKRRNSFLDLNQNKEKSVQVPKVSKGLLKTEVSPSVDQPNYSKFRAKEPTRADIEGEFTLIKLFPKGIHSFFKVMNHHVISSNQFQTFKPNNKRKFNISIELDGKYSMKLKNDISGLSASELKFRRQYEKENEASSYVVNVIIHKGDFGLLTGIGYSQASLKTGYMAPDVRYETETRYSMIEPNFDIRPNGTSVSLIKEYQDTTAIHSEESFIKGQADKNTFRWFQIPIQARFEYPYKRLRFSVRVGAEFQWLYKAEEFLINSKLDGLTAIGDSEQKLKRFTVNPLTQFNAGYQLSPHLQFGANFFGSKQLGSNFAKYVSRFSQLGIGWYLGYRF
jgi:hypothetical protein